MCGITGIVRIDGGAAIPRNSVRAMTDAIVHRGPDEDGYFDAPGIEFGALFAQAGECIARISGLCHVRFLTLAEGPLAVHPATAQMFCKGSCLRGEGMRFTERWEVSLAVYVMVMEA